MNTTSVVTPEAFLTYLNNGHCPDLSHIRVAVLLYDYLLFKQLKEKYKGVKIEGFTTTVAHIDNMVLLCCGFGIGSPAAVAAVEELIAAGVTRFISFGSAGGIAPDIRLGDVIVCKGALKDEGTSAHYIPDESYSFPDPDLTIDIERYLRKEFPELRTGKTWTTDAPYRETREKVLLYREEGILTVEMEASALFTLGRFRNVEVAALMVVGDLVLPEGWIPGFRDEHVTKTIDNIANHLVRFFCNHE